MKAYIIKETGGIGVLKLEKIKEPVPSKNELIIKHTTIGINAMDVEMRSGIQKVDLPATLGIEGCGYIEGPENNLCGFKIGQKVCYLTAGIGSYAEKRIVPARCLIPVPGDINDKVISASMVKAMTAHYLLFRCYMVREKQKILVTGAAGGVGQYLCNWARFIGAEVIGVVSSDEKIAIALENGCHHAINYNKEDLVSSVMKITNSIGVSAIYDMVGKKLFPDILKCLSPVGIFISVGQTSGNIESFDPSLLLKKSLYFTKPSLYAYKGHRMELVLSANEVFDKIRKGILKTNYNAYSFDKIPEIHKKIESGKNTGSNIVVF